MPSLFDENFKYDNIILTTAGEKKTSLTWLHVLRALIVNWGQVHNTETAKGKFIKCTTCAIILTSSLNFKHIWCLTFHYSSHDECLYCMVDLEVESLLCAVLCKRVCMRVCCCGYVALDNINHRSMNIGLLQ